MSSRARPRHHVVRSGRALWLALAAVCIGAQATLIAGAGWAVANPRIVADTITVWQYDATPAISGYATRAGMSEHGRFIFYASRPEVVDASEFDRRCSRSSGVGILGCYTIADGRIHLYDITNVDLDEFEVVVAAHEMLHAAWDRLSPAERAALTAPLEDVFNGLPSDSDVRQRIADYEAADPNSRVPELYAIVGTEVGTLPAELEQHYARYFSDRASVVSLAEQVQAVFLALRSELERLAAELTQLSAEIDAERAEADAVAAALEADVAAFNERAARPGGYTSRAAFDRDRQALLDRQAALALSVDATNAKVDRYNTILAEFTELNDEAAALNRDLNIDPQPRSLND